MHFNGEGILNLDKCARVDFEFEYMCAFEQRTNPFHTPSTMSLGTDAIPQYVCFALVLLSISFFGVYSRSGFFFAAARDGPPHVYSYHREP